MYLDTVKICFCSRILCIFLFVVGFVGASDSHIRRFATSYQDMLLLRPILDLADNFVGMTYVNEDKEELLANNAVLRSGKPKYDLICVCFAFICVCTDRLKAVFLCVSQLDSNSTGVKRKHTRTIKFLHT